MIFLYNDNDLRELTKLKKRNLFLSLLFFALFVISLIIFVVVSTYKTRILFSITSSVVGFVLVAFGIFFISKFSYFKRLETEYQTLLNKEEKTIKCEILECSDFLTTLPDKSRCYEVLIKTDEREIAYYLSEIFNREDIKPGKCKIVVSYDYIKGYQYES